MLKEIDEDRDIESKSDNEIVKISNSTSREEESENLNDINENLNKKKSFVWGKNSCSFDSFISIFIYSILPIIKEFINPLT